MAKLVVHKLRPYSWQNGPAVTMCGIRRTSYHDGHFATVTCPGCLAALRKK
ncbi:hypothetical protein [Crossiella sp. CA198]|uniref:hypothetical protein n=1 Tax=Crossiella sp. CA198 TaxID=3455607 RepID=UPI003F8D73A5